MAALIDDSKIKVGVWQPQHDTEQPLPPSILLQGCHRGVLNLKNALRHMDTAGTQLTRSLALALQDTPYKCVADTLGCQLSDVYTSALSASSEALLAEMEAMIANLQTVSSADCAQLYGQTLCHTSLLLTKLKKQYFSVCHAKMVELVHSLLCLKGEDLAAVEVTKLVLKLGLADGLETPNKSNSSLPSTPWGSPKTRKSSSRSEREAASSKSPAKSTGFRIMSLFERKSPPHESKSSFYVDVDCGGAQQTDAGGSVVRSNNTDNIMCVEQPVPALSVTSDNSLNGAQNADGISSQPSDMLDSITPAPHRSQLATEEELESVINLLSGSGCCPMSPMQVIPEVPTQDPLQLTVPQIYRTSSPASNTASDTQLDEISLAKAQVHRRSEGCLDLSAVGNSMWPQQKFHHRASLPSVQIYSASGQRTGGYDSLPPSLPPSPVPGYARETLSPGVIPGYFRHDPPSPFRVQQGVGGGQGGQQQQQQRASVQHQQWRGNIAGLGGGGGGGGSLCGASRHGGSLDAGSGQHGTWPLYTGLSGVSPAGSGVDTPSSWSGLQDCSDLSDDSSSEDQFFAVDKHFSHRPKDGSSDEEGDGRRSGQTKNSQTWPLPHSHMTSATSQLLEPPEMYSAHHRSIHMQWSDPIPQRTSGWQAQSDLPSQKPTSRSMQGFGGLQ